MKIRIPTRLDGNIKKSFTIIFIVISLSWITGFSIAKHNNNIPEESKDTTNISNILKNYSPSCGDVINNKIDLNNHPGRYYYLIGTCIYEKINNESDFEATVKIFIKSESYNYPLSYLALGYLYESKYQMGSKVYGSKGKPDDLILAIKNYKIAADFGSSYAQNNLGEIYLDEVNLGEKTRTQDSNRDVSSNKSPIQLPDIDQALFWFQKAAKNGNPAAQGTLGDLYKQGIGVTQDYVMAYVWDSLSYTSQMRFNKTINQSTIGRSLVADLSDTRNDIYLKLTDEQKNVANKIVNDFQSKYIMIPTNLNRDSSNLQSFLSARNSLILLDKVQNAYEKYRLSLLKDVLKLCGASYEYHLDQLSVTVDFDAAVKALPLALKAKDVIYNSKLSETDLINDPVTMILIASLKAAIFATPEIYEANPNLDGLKVNVYLTYPHSDGLKKKTIMFSYKINRYQYKHIDWENFDISKAALIFENFKMREAIV